MAFPNLWSLLSCVILAQYTLQFQLYIPGLDSQPLSVSELGVDTAGRTTWAIAPAATAKPEDIGIPGVVTLVEGPDDSVMTVAVPDESYVIDCTFKDGIATCTGVDSNGSTAINTETISPFSVDGGPTAGSPPASVTPSSASSGSPSSVTPAPSRPLSSNSASSNPASSSTPQQQVDPNNAGSPSNGHCSFAGLVGVAVLAGALSLAI